LNTFKNFVKGIVPVEEFAQKSLNTLRGDKVYVWRNSVTDNYKVGVGYK
jgi:hypothetical protein